MDYNSSCLSLPTRAFTAVASGDDRIGLSAGWRERLHRRMGDRIDYLATTFKLSEVDISHAQTLNNQMVQRPCTPTQATLSYPAMALGRPCGQWWQDWCIKIDRCECSPPQKHSGRTSPCHPRPMNVFLLEARHNATSALTLTTLGRFSIKAEARAAF